MKKTIALLILASLVLASCAVQKRKYQRGYHISWGRSAGRQAEKKTGAVAENRNSQGVTAAFPQQETMPPLEASANAHSGGSLPALQNRRFLKDEPCDELLYRDGSEIKAKVFEVTETEVKYKKCDMPDGPTYVAKKSDIFMIKYANGTREVFKAPEVRVQDRNTYKPQPEYNRNRRNHPMANAALVFGILSCSIYLAIIFAPLAIIFGSTAIRKIKENPTLYKGIGPANAGKTMGIVALCVVAFILLLVLVSL